MPNAFTVKIEVEVNDIAELRTYALQRALAECNIDEAEFETGESDDVGKNVRYYLCWAFDAGTPRNCGFQIDNSSVERDEWSGSPDTKDPSNFWIDDLTGERVDARTGERTAA